MMLQAMISTCSLLGLLDSNLSESISISVDGCGLWGKIVVDSRNNKS